MAVFNIRHAPWFDGAGLALLPLDGELRKKISLHEITGTPLSRGAPVLLTVCGKERISSLRPVSKAVSLPVYPLYLAPERGGQGLEHLFDRLISFEGSGYPLLD